MRPKLSRTQKFSLLRKEITELKRLLWQTPQAHRQIVFYAAQAQYISFFQGILTELLSRRAAISYITSDFDDPILADSQPGMHTFFLDKLFPLAAPFLDAKAIVYTMPDLNLFHIRRSIFEANHIFVFHSLCSAHMGLRRDALAHFDTVFCNGPYQEAEIRKLEALYRFKPKTLLQTGYYRLEKIHAGFKSYRQATASASSAKKILIAPSWQKENILETCGHQLVETLLQAGYEVIVRPHPMTIYRNPERLQRLQSDFGEQELFSLDTYTVSEQYYYEADVLITDWSGISMEYAFGTERPVLFIDLPPKVHNYDFLEVGIEPLESSIRSEIGKLILPGEVGQAGIIVAEFLKNSTAYRERIVAARAKHIAHFGNSAKISADYILQISGKEAAS